MNWNACTFNSKSYGEYGDLDWDSAIVLWQREKWNGSLVHLQQAAEKYFRSILADSGEQPCSIKGHSLPDLAKACDFDVSEEESAMLKYLTDGYTILRYPTEKVMTREPSREVVENACDLVQRIRIHALKLYYAQQESKPVGVKRLTLE